MATNLQLSAPQWTKESYPTLRATSPQRQLRSKHPGARVPKRFTSLCKFGMEGSTPEGITVKTRCQPTASEEVLPQWRLLGAKAGGWFLSQACPSNRAPEQSPQSATVHTL